jgi:hypothetical protein
MDFQDQDDNTKKEIKKLKYKIEYLEYFIL